MAIGFMFFVTLAARAVTARKTDETSLDKQSRPLPPRGGADSVEPPGRPLKPNLRRVRHRRFDPGAVAAAFGRAGGQTWWGRVGMLLCVAVLIVWIGAGSAFARAPQRGPATPGVAVTALRAALNDRDARVRREAVFALKRLGPRAAGALVAALRSHDPVVRASAALALGRVGDRRALPSLRRALKDRDARVRREAVFALKRMGPQAVPALVAALRSRDPAVRASAALALGRVGGAGRSAVRSRRRPKRASAGGRRSKRLIRVQATLTVEEPSSSGTRGASRARKRKRVIRIQATFNVDPKTVRALFSGKGTPSRPSK